MRVVITVRGDGDQGGAEGASAARELRQWLVGERELRGRVHPEGPADPEAGTMGPAADALVALLEPGGVAAVFAGALIAWVQTRRGSYTVTVTRADGTEVTVSSRHVRGLSPDEIAALAERLARPSGEGEGEGGNPGRAR
ncbi:effector-associated constant component EACC1 [Streptomyces radicis]|uniref:Uncharacterized protein n=1 Tax=Streptomyces radicis TaxID=1750517 RepID=A0A3A9WVQ9_9ACTN|nr:hypothetical protein [Streptomyces radicis]RKN10217.1 hypothetical protein D7319_10765 [Streptomyces radicis]RKN24559.1 hypothetical protein D7318_11945 [Streptomyces radicis]